MSVIFEMLNEHLSGAAVKQFSDQLGTDPERTQKALAAALPVLLGGLARNANQSPEQAQALAGALDRDHDGSLLESLGGLLGGGGGSLGGLLGGRRGSSDLGGLIDIAGDLLGGGAPRSKTTDGDGILEHILGSRRRSVEEGVAKASGLDVAKVSRLLAMLAPILMGVLGRVKRQQHLDADGLTTMLNRERASVEQQTPGMAQGGLLSMLDRDGDGSVTDDVAQLGSALARSGLLGNLFGKR